ncbi:hypothetical protein B0J11DRAFT_588655, partial [Dendryphion nanum]
QTTINDVTNFALYQANQRTYEAAFLKNFIAHALHPDVIHQRFGNQSREPTSIARYLQSVTNNIKEIMDRIIRNTHIKCVYFLAVEDAQSLPFINVHHLKEDLFSDFGPQNLISVAPRLNQAWHRVHNLSDMVSYSTTDYPQTNRRLPFAEVEEACIKLLNPKFLHRLSAGEVMQIGSEMNNPTQNKPLALPFINRDSSSSSVYTPSVSLSTPFNASPARPKVQGETDLGHLPSSQNSVELLHGHQKLNTSGPTSPILLENIVGYSDNGADTANSTAQHVVTNNQALRSWEARLLDDHRRQLTRIQFNSTSRSYYRPPFITDAIKKAVVNGIVEPPTSEVYSLIHEYDARQAKRSLPKHGIAANQIQALTSTVDLPEDSLVQPIEPHRHNRGLAKANKKSNPLSNVRTNRSKMRQVDKPPRKKVRTMADQRRYNKDTPLHHPSGSKKLESHQILPSGAYFERKDPDEKFVWRCGIKHAMGYYYNAGDRRNCVGCFTHIDKNPNKKWMDFYMPTKSHFFQPAPPYVIWKPNKPLEKEVKQNNISHNGIAKAAYWYAINLGSSQTEATEKAIEAVQVHLRPKPKPEAEPTPEPEPEPIDLGPHPSGSTKMEHGQGIPQFHYFERKYRHEEFAWRCDVSHALGRYYMAGDKRSCPGCGSNRGGKGRQLEMDFYLPLGAVIRQVARGLMKWVPRRPYKVKNGTTKPQMQSHNQICSKKYWELVDGGEDLDSALALAIQATDDHLDQLACSESSEDSSSEESEEEQMQENKIGPSGSHTKSMDVDSLFSSDHSEVVPTILSMVTKKRKREDSSDEEDEEDGKEQVQGVIEEKVAIIEVSSSSDDSSSSSDSE